MADEVWDPDLEFLDWMRRVLEDAGAMDRKSLGGASEYTYGDLVEMMRSGKEKWARDMYRNFLDSPSYARFLRWKGQKDREEGEGK